MKPLVEINNSYSQIKGLPTVAFNALRKELSYLDDPQAAYFSGGWQQRRYMIDKKGVFPTGLLARVIKTVPEAEIKDLRVRPQIKPNAYTATYPHKAYRDQLMAADMALKHERALISMPTGTGKSLVIALIIAKSGLKTLVVVPSLEIKKQLEETIHEIFGKNRNIVIENIDSKKLKNLTDFDMLIIDEAHHTAAKTYRDLNKNAWTKIYYRVFLTATPFRNQNHEHLLFESIAGSVVHKLSYIDAIKNNYIVPVEGYYIQLPKSPVEGNSWPQVYSELVVNNDYRNGVIAGLLRGLDQQEKSTLCLVKEIKHGEILSDITGVPFVNGQDEESRQYIQQFNNRKINALIGTTGVLGEGVDTKSCEYVIIAGLGKAKSAFMQQVGRSVRRYPGKESAKVIIFKDDSHKFTKSHFATQKQILLEEYGVKVLEL